MTLIDVHLCVSLKSGSDIYNLYLSKNTIIVIIEKVNIDFFVSPYKFWNAYLVVLELELELYFNTFQQSFRSDNMCTYRTSSRC